MPERGPPQAMGGDNWSFPALLVVIVVGMGIVLLAAS